MRPRLIPLGELTPEQKPLREGIAGNFNAFKAEREDGALMGPTRSTRTSRWRSARA